MLKHLIRSIKMLFVLTLLTGFFYPLLITGLVQILFPHQANGSPVIEDGKIIGSELVGQYFDDPKYFWGRPSATSPAYNASSSSGSNLGPTNKSLIDAVESRVKILHDADPENTAAIPADLVTASASGLDPHISVEAAKYQTHRIARARGVSEEKIIELINQSIEPRTFKIWGQPRINVLKLNRMLNNFK